MEGQFLVGLVVGQVQHQHGPDNVGVAPLTQMAVDQGQLTSSARGHVDLERVGDAGLLQAAVDGALLVERVNAPVAVVVEQVAGADKLHLNDTVADRGCRHHNLTI